MGGLHVTDVDIFASAIWNLFMGETGHKTIFIFCTVEWS